VPPLPIRPFIKPYFPPSKRWAILARPSKKRILLARVTSPKSFCSATSLM